MKSSFSIVLAIVVVAFLGANAQGPFPAADQTLFPVTYPLSGALPSEFQWFGGAGLSYSMTPSFTITGDAGDGSGGRGLESVVTYTGDVNIVVNFYRTTLCNNPGIVLFQGTNNWSLGLAAGRIEFAWNCDVPTLYGELDAASSQFISTTNAWFTLRVLHQPTLGSTTAFVYAGPDADIDTATPLSADTLAESLSGAFRVAIIAAANPNSASTTFTMLRLSADLSGTMSSTASWTPSKTVTASNTPTISITPTISMSRSRTPSVTPTRSFSSSVTPTRSATPSFTPATVVSLQDSIIPAGFHWFGGASLDYTLNPYLGIHGDPGEGTGGRGLESTTYILSDANILVSFLENDTCSNPGLSIFMVSSNWASAPRHGRIQFSLGCTDAFLYGETTVASAPLPTDDGWFTMRLFHQPSIGFTTAFLYSGFDVDIQTATPIVQVSIAERFVGPYKFGIAADQVSTSLYTQFANLRWSYVLPATRSNTPTVSRTASVTASVTPTSSRTPSITPSITPSSSKTATRTVTGSVSPSISRSSTASITISATNSATPSISRSSTRSPTTSTTSSVTPSTSMSASYTPAAFASLNGVIPIGFQFFGGGYNLESTFLPNFAIHGDAGEALDDPITRGLESTFPLYSDAMVVVSFFRNSRCSDAGVMIFGTQSAWSVTAAPGRIQFSMACDKPGLLGTSSTAFGSDVVGTGVWFTMMIHHQPGIFQTNAALFAGYDVDVQVATPLVSLSINEWISGPYKFAIHADQDNTTLWTEFSNLRWLYVTPPTPSNSPTPSRTMTKTVTPSVTASVTSSTSRSSTPTVTSTPSYTATCSTSITTTSSVTITSTVTRSITPSNTRSRSISATPTFTVTPSSTPLGGWLWDLLTFPFGFSWYGGASLTYTMYPSFSMTGDAGTGSRALEYNGYISGDKNIVVSYYKNEMCSDASISIFTSQAYWNWGTSSYRIQAPVDCNNPSLYGFSQSQTGPTLSFLGWYTLHLLHQPSLGRTTFYVYNGFDVNPSTTIPSSTLTITEYITGSYRFGIGADQDNLGTWTAFQNLRVF